MIKRLCMVALAVALLAVGVEARAGCTAGTTVTTTTTALLASDDLSTPRSYLKICNAGPGLMYYCIGTSNVCTAAVGIPLAPLACDTMGSVIQSAGVWKNPPNSDVAAIADSVTPRTSATVCDY